MIYSYGRLSRLVLRRGDVAVVSPLALAGKKREGDRDWLHQAQWRLSRVSSMEVGPARDTVL